MKRLLTAGLAGVLALAAAGCGNDDSPKSGKITLGIVQGQDFTHALPARYAEAKGIFAAQGLDVEIVDFSAGSDLVKAVAGGTVDVAEATGLDVVAAAAAGVDLKAFYGTAAATPMSVIVKEGSPVQTLADLSGKKVGISKFGSLTDFTVRLIGQQAGAKDVKAVPLGAPSANTAALGKGDVDAIILPVEFAYTMAAAGTPVRPIRIAELTPDSQFAVLAAPAKVIAGSDTQKLTKAYADAITRLQGDRAGTVALSVAKLGMTDEVAGRTFDELAKDFTADGKIHNAGLEAYAAQLPTLGIAKQVPAESAYYDPRFS